MQDHGDGTAKGRDAFFSGKGREAAEGDGAGRRLIESAEDFQECCFASAVGAGDEMYSAFGDAEGVYGECEVLPIEAGKFTD